MTQVHGIMMQAVEAAKNELKDGSGSYESVLEGYGDMCRTLICMQDAVKLVKKDIGKIVEMMNYEDTQEMQDKLRLMYIDAQQTALIAIRMAATVAMEQETVTRIGGGDILSMLEDMGDE